MVGAEGFELRLDLFNRRFDIYLRALDCYAGLFNGNRESDEARMMLLVKAVREARFIFPKASGVHELLEEFRSRASAFSSYPQSREILKDMPEERAKLGQKKIEDTQWLHNSMPALEKKMEPYIQFDRL